MAENLMNCNHKANSEGFRRNCQSVHWIDCKACGFVIPGKRVEVDRNMRCVKCGRSLKHWSGD